MSYNTKNCITFIFEYNSRRVSPSGDDCWSSRSTWGWGQASSRTRCSFWISVLQWTVSGSPLCKCHRLKCPRSARFQSRRHRRNSSALCWPWNSNLARCRARNRRGMLKFHQQTCLSIFLSPPSLSPLLSKKTFLLLLPPSSISPNCSLIYNKNAQILCTKGHEKIFRFPFSPFFFFFFFILFVFFSFLSFLFFWREEKRGNNWMVTKSTVCPTFFNVFPFLDTISSTREAMPNER